MNYFRSAIIIATLACCFSGCGTPEIAEYRQGQLITATVFNLHTANMGIHPDRSVLDDPNNPFRHYWVTEDAKWDINDHAGDVAAFYCWASILAWEPTGEHQYYSAEKLRAMVENDRVNGSTKVFVRDMAIRAYQAVLDHFPSSVSYLADGVRSFPLAPLAYQAIVEMGGTVTGGWVMIETPSGPQVIQLDNDADNEETP